MACYAVLKIDGKDTLVILPNIREGMLDIILRERPKITISYETLAGVWGTAQASNFSVPNLEDDDILWNGLGF